MKGITIIEVMIVIYTISLWVYMKKNKYRDVTRKFIILFVGVLLFEIMSEPMWLNEGFDSWAYIYKDITWVITLGWVSIFMTSILIVDHAFRHLPEKSRFWLYLLFIEAITVPIEAGLVESGVRKYAPVLTATMSGLFIPYTSVPLEAVYAIPLFTSLILTFYKYINHLFDTTKNATR